MDEPGFAADAPAVAHVLVDALIDDLRIEGDDGHHLARARRLGVGEAVTAADGRGAWRAYVVAAVRRGAVDLRATGGPRGEPELVPGLEVAFALTKGVKPEVVVRQLTELGVDAVVPVHAARSVSRPDAAREVVLVERLRRVAREAAMQSRRARLVRIGAVSTLEGVLGRPGLVLAERAPEDAPALPDPPGGSWTVLVGPEGGFSIEERAQLRSVPILAAGVHVLRAETAAVAAAALLTARRRPGPGRSGPGS